MRVGKIVQVDLREVWKQESSDFTQWLSENLTELCDAVEMNLELINTEQRVDESRYAIDILAEDDSGQYVIIENQLEKTDHTHLGQIITYASNMDAKTVIWITKHPRQEHINAINWLNEASDKRFYLVQLEALRIDDSDPAPFFSVICRPSEESKVLGKNKKQIGEARDARRRRKDLSDTIIVPARKEGFEKVFLGENCWYAIRLRENRISQIKWIAGYQVAPISAITHIAEVREIVPYQDSGKYLVQFKGPAKEIKPIKMGNRSKIQGPAYCEHDRLQNAKSVDDLLTLDIYSDEEDAA
ncbi:MAG: hypothetical protein K2X81_09745 [Candidatus Obscuribacterales bacterium]|nr:hypothetical protein [Candidatus Obscuribacterales bacterium]